MKPNKFKTNKLNHILFFWVIQVENTHELECEILSEKLISLYDKRENLENILMGQWRQASWATV